MKIVQQNLGRTTDRIDIHTVDAFTDSAAKTGGTEGEILEESIGDSVFVTPAPSLC